MQASRFWKRFVETTESDDLDDLRRDIILIIGGVLLAIGWLLTLSAIGYDGHLEYLPTALILLAGSVIGIWLRFNYFRVGLYWIIAVLIGAIA